MSGRSLVLVVVAALLLAACRSEAEPPAADRATTTSIEDYPDAQVRALAARARERRPVENSALPPRHLESDRWPESLVDRNLIVSGGVPPDGIRSIDEPSFDAVASVDWLGDEEPVAIVTVGAETRIYPIQVLIWHEIVNDVVDGEPIAVTYCPLCNSVVAFQAEVDGVTLDFGTSGALYQSALVMYDRQTESLWTHFDGRAVIGTMMGTELTLIPAGLVSWADAAATAPDALVLNRKTGLVDRSGGSPYGVSPYPNYETAAPSAGHVAGEVDDRLEPKQRVVGLDLGGERQALDRRLLETEGIVEIEIDGDRLVVVWQPGTSSPVDGEAIVDGADVGAVGVFRAEIDDRPLTFAVDDGVIVDTETGSTWSVLGEATAGPLAGARLDAVVHLDTYWFAWVRYHPDTDVVR